MSSFISSFITFKNLLRVLFSSKTRLSSSACLPYILKSSATNAPNFKAFVFAYLFSILTSERQSDLICPSSFMHVRSSLRTYSWNYWNFYR